MVEGLPAIPRGADEDLQVLLEGRLALEFREELGPERELALVLLGLEGRIHRARHASATPRRGRAGRPGTSRAPALRRRRRRRLPRRVPRRGRRARGLEHRLLGRLAVEAHVGEGAHHVGPLGRTSPFPPFALASGAHQLALEREHHLLRELGAHARYPLQRGQVLRIEGGAQGLGPDA